MIEIGRRLKDVLFALDVAGTYHQSLGRLQLQKFIYLADTLSLVWEIIAANGYQTYKHGPYDPNIQNAVDVLSFRGAVDIARIRYESDNVIQVNYQISKHGIGIVKSFHEELGVSAKYELYGILGHHINLRGWSQLKNLVYSEATFLTEKMDGLGKPLVLDSLLSNQSFRVLLGFNNLVVDSGGKINKKNLVSIFFRVLDNYSLIGNQ
ncbi:MAG: hypothetical protein J0L96_18595 [Anaerolineae bacterium]|nr:hypothetical protein [Anaerolineae bacterium]